MPKLKKKINNRGEWRCEYIERNKINRYIVNDINIVKTQFQYISLNHNTKMVRRQREQSTTEDEIVIGKPVGYVQNYR